MPLARLDTSITRDSSVKSHSLLWAKILHIWFVRITKKWTFIGFIDPDWNDCVESISAEKSDSCHNLNTLLFPDVWSGTLSLVKNFTYIFCFCRNTPPPVFLSFLLRVCQMLSDKGFVPLETKVPPVCHPLCLGRWLVGWPRVPGEGEVVLMYQRGFFWKSRFVLFKLD